MYVPLWVTTEPNSMHGLTRTGRGFLRYLRIVVVNFLFLVRHSTGFLFFIDATEAAEDASI